jgi:hypothetical protein
MDRRRQLRQCLITCLALADYDRAIETIGKTFGVLSTKRV